MRILETTTMDAETPAITPGCVPAPAEVAGAVPEGWTRICRVDDLLVERGAAALVDGRQIALFRTYDGRLFAIDQIDPFSGAAILSRGIVGIAGECRPWHPRCTSRSSTCVPACVSTRRARNR